MPVNVWRKSEGDRRGSDLGILTILTTRFPIAGHYHVAEPTVTLKEPHDLVDGLLDYAYTHYVAGSNFVVASKAGKAVCPIKLRADNIVVG